MTIHLQNTKGIDHEDLPINLRDVSCLDFSRHPILGRRGAGGSLLLEGMLGKGSMVMAEEAGRSTLVSSMSIVKVVLT